MGRGTCCLPGGALACPGHREPQGGRSVDLGTREFSGGFCRVLFGRLGKKELQQEQLQQKILKFSCLADANASSFSSLAKFSVDSDSRVPIRPTHDPAIWVPAAVNETYFRAEKEFLVCCAGSNLFSRSTCCRVI